MINLNSRLILFLSFFEAVNRFVPPNTVPYMEITKTTLFNNK